MYELQLRGRGQPKPKSKDTGSWLDSDRKSMPKNFGSGFPIVVNSYEMALYDAKFLAAHKWKYVVVDEGHRLKNSKCLLLRELKRVPMYNKFFYWDTSTE